VSTAEAEAEGTVLEPPAWEALKKAGEQGRAGPASRLSGRRTEGMGRRTVNGRGTWGGEGKRPGGMPGASGHLSRACQRSTRWSSFPFLTLKNSRERPGDRSQPTTAFGEKEVPR